MDDREKKDIPDLERRLREAGGEFIEAHRAAETAIREATGAGMPPEAIAYVSALSPETVAAFLRQLDRHAP